MCAVYLIIFGSWKNRMAKENEIKTKIKETKATTATKAPTDKSSDKKSQAEKVVAKKPNVSVSSIKDRIDKKRLKTTIGIALILLSFYLFLSCFSYLFTWEEDQNRVLNTGLFQLLFDQNPEPVANWFGKFGAWISHLLIFNWFGLASFALGFFTFVVGLRVMLNYRIFPLRQTTAVVALSLVWFSILFGFFADSVNYLGGSFGFYINEWLSLSLGKFGSLIFILVLGYIFLVILFNPDFKALLQKFKGSMSENEDETPPDAENVNLADLRIVNTIKDDQIAKDDVRGAVLFDEDEDGEDDDDLTDEELSFTVKKEAVKKDDNDDFEIEIPQEEKLVDLKKDDSLEVEIPENDQELTDTDLNALQKEFGNYDPKLDLASYVLPPIDLLKEYGNGGVSVNKQELEDNKNKIVETLSHYKIDIAKIKATVGPTVTLYEIIPAPGVRISKIKNLEDDIALSLSALGIRIIAPIPGKGTIGIEVPNSSPEMVSMRSLIASEKFQNSDYELPIVMGKTITNETFVFDLTKMPHLLVAGATGQGKSVGLNAIIISILYKKHPSQVKFVLVDPKKVELTLYNRIERHFLAKLPGEEDAIITDTSKVVNTLNSLCIEMDNRYELLKTAQVRTIKEYNEKFVSRKLNPEKGHRYLPYIIVLIDEFADLIMTAGKEVEHPIARIAQLARAIGIHLIVATQRPSVNVITGMIKANFPARIAFRVLSKIDSRTILDASGADQLIGRGDMLISTGNDLKRLQCGFVDTPEVDEICAFIGDQRAYPDAMILPEYTAEGADGNSDVDIDDIDVMFVDAARIVVLHQQGSASLLQRKLKLGYNRAGRIVDQLEGFGIIGPFQGSKARDVLFGDEVALNEFLMVKGLV